ncbi:MAG: hypothetical protein RO469_00200 [Thermincola sp.]|nr:hypothetical protein [Thermincola sp.]
MKQSYIRNIFCFLVTTNHLPYSLKIQLHYTFFGSAVQDKISKESLAEYLYSLEGQRIARPSRQHQKLIEAYMDRKQNSGMAFGSMSL